MAAQNKITTIFAGQHIGTRILYLQRKTDENANDSENDTEENFESTVISKLIRIINWQIKTVCLELKMVEITKCTSENTAENLENKNGIENLNKKLVYYDNES